MAKKVRSDFFNPAADLNSRGYRKNFATNGEPDVNLMTDLSDSVIHFKETEDRAKQSTGAEADEDLVGHVQIATDVEAKANTSGLEVATTKVVHAAQLPTVTTESSAFSTFTGNTLEVAADGAITTRNEFIAKLSSAFTTWLVNELTTISAGTGEVNTASNATSGSNIAGVFKTKTALDLVLRAIQGDSYLTVTENTDTVDLTLNTASLVTYLNSNVSFPVETASNQGGFAEIFKVLTGTDFEFRTLQSSDSSVTITQNASDIDLIVNETYINNLITTIINDTMVGQGDAASYLFSAKSSATQILGEGVKLIFSDDVSDGFYDYNNTWTTSQWVANADAATDADLVLNANIELEYNTAATAALGRDLDIEMVHIDDGTAVETVISTQTYTVTGAELINTKVYLNFIDIKPSASAIAIGEGDRIFIRIVSAGVANDDLAAGYIQMNTGSIIYNGEV